MLCGIHAIHFRVFPLPSTLPLGCIVNHVLTCLVLHQITIVRITIATAWLPVWRFGVWFTEGKAYYPPGTVVKGWGVKVNESRIGLCSGMLFFSYMCFCGCPCFTVVYPLRPLNNRMPPCTP